jgi:malonate decarboxylase delta subunit
VIEKLSFEYTAEVDNLIGRARVGVVASGNLEVLLQGSTDRRSTVYVRTNTRGFEKQWRAVLNRFFQHHGVAVQIEINDSGASPPVVALRLEQALEAAKR